MEQENKLEIRNLHKTYKNKKALDGVSFILNNGLYGLLGPNGAGKSTMIHIITGSLAPTKGKVLWNGTNMLKLGRKFRSILGFMPQQQMLYDSFTGRRLLSYMAALKEIPYKETDAEINRVASLVHLTDELDKRLAAYSGGMKQRLLAASALMGNPKLVIMDEPTAGLDPKERVHMRNILAQLAQTCIVIIATHVVSDVEQVAKEIILLKDGQMIDKAPPNTLIETYAPQKNLEEVYLTLFEEERT